MIAWAWDGATRDLRSSPRVLAHDLRALQDHAGLEACPNRMAVRLGLIRLLDPLDLREEPREQAARPMALTYRVDLQGTNCGIVRGLRQTLQELRDAPAIRPDVPSLVLTHETPAGMLSGATSSSVSPGAPRTASGESCRTAAI